MEALVALLCACLPECYTMRNEAQVLAATQRLQAHTDRRIRQTAQMVIDVMQPGGLTSKGSGWFSGADVRYADGTRLQRIGLRPDVAARPTLRGLREGRDEVLERALRLLREGR